MILHLALLVFLAVVVIFSMYKANAKGKAIGKDSFRVGLPAFLLQEVQNIYSPLPVPGRFRSDSQHGRATARVPRLSWVGVVLLGCLTHDACAVLPSLITTSVGQQSQPVSVTVTLTASGVAVAPQALLQGFAGMDFSVASGGTCAAGATYNTGQTCTVNVVFAPKFPGLRRGAVVLRATGGTLLGSTLVAGNAIGSLSVLSPGVINTVAGDGELNFRTDGVLATQAPIFLPYGVIVDPAGNVYLSDTNNNRIRRVDALSSLITTIAGNGVSGYSGDGGPATQANISQPGGLAMDGAGNIYFADSDNDIIRRIDAISGIITTVAGVPMAQGYAGDGAAATLANLSSPRSIAFDSIGDLFIADTSNNVIREVNATTGTIGTVAGTGAAGYNGDAIPATAALLNSPWTVSVGADNSLYIADLTNNRVRKVAGGMISTVAGTGGRNFAGDDGPATAADLNDPTSVILDPAGDLYIADSGNNRVRKVNASTGIIETVTGNDSEQFAGDGGPANLASLYAPYALYFDQSGNLFLADTLHNRIRRILATPVALAYPVMRVGKTSAPQAQGLENDGNSSLNLAAPVLLNAALDSTTTTCSFATPMAPSTTCNLGVEFAPTVLGLSVLGSVTLNSDAGDSPAIINLSGQVLSVEPTTVSLVSSVNPSLVSQLVIFTATVASADPSRGGPVTFLDGTTPVCSNINLVAGSASCSTSTLALGSHNMTASYAGDENNAASVSPVLIQIVKQQANLTLTVSPNPANVAQGVTLTLTATAATGTPSGAVVFFDGATALSGNVGLSGSGVATYSTTQLTAGQHSLSAQYAGDTSNASGQSNVVTEVVNQISTVTAIASSNSTVNVGTSVTFTATVSNASGPAPTGAVQFTEGATVLGSGAVDSNGHASLTLATLAPGTHTIVATYSGDTDNSGSASIGLVETVQQIATTTVLASDLNPASAGATIHLSATVAIGAGASPDGAITGLVTFSEGAVILGTAQVNSSGIASIAVSTLAVGTHNISASYPGNTNYAGNISNILVQSISSTSTTTVLTAGGMGSLSGKPVTLTVTVTSPTGTPTGNVIFRDGATNIGQGTLNAQGVATLSTSALVTGPHTLTAVYQGDSSYLTSTSASLVETISLATTGLTLASPASPVDVGTTVTFTSVLTGNGVAPAGALTLHDGSAVIATQNVTNTGTFTFSISSLAIGTHTLTAVYAGDANNSPATSNAIAITVQQAASSTSLTASANPSTLGQSLTLTAVVTSSGANIAGTVSFLDGGSAIGSAALSANGTAALTTNSLSFGPHTLTAVYSGDTNHTASTSPVLTEQIVQAAGVTLTSSLNPSISGTNVVFTATMSGVGSLIPTGSITFNDGANTLGTVQLGATGAGSLQTAALTVGSHTIAANYSGDSNYAVASSSLVQTVQSANTQVALTASANPATYATPLALTASVTSNGGLATGTVNFTDGGNAIGSASLNASGVAILTTSSLAPGTHSIVANYAGDGRASASTSTPLALNVRQTTSVALATSSSPAQTLSAILLTAAVTNSGVTPVTGTVTFSDGATLLGTAAVDATGHATLTVPSLAAGNHTIVASYGGDNNDFLSVSPALTQGVQLRATTTALATSQTDPTNPQQVTLIGLVSWTGPVPPTGSITFTNGSTVIGSSPINTSGAATVNIALNTNITENIVATYNGDVSYAPSASLATLVTGGPATQFTLALNPPSVSIQSKQHIVIQVSVASINGFSDTLLYGCLGLPFAATCTFSSVQSSLASGGTSTVQLTIDTGDPLGAGALAGLNRPRNSNLLLCFLPGCVLAGFALFRRRRASLQGLLLLIVAIAVTLSASGCAGLQVNGTPAGSYTFKVTASGQGTGATESQVMNLTVTP
jgi:sugar lactone lactonase YvrE/plastocyanin